jgi:peptidoglycan/xylan/chitin deacetylase (PgdA/CDA1 family)
MAGSVAILFGAIVLLSLASLFFDEALFVRKGTIYRGTYTHKVVALTFNDGPAPEWTPQILKVLNQYKVKATFFMLGNHVAKFPDIAKQVAQEGHEIGNHTDDHHGIFWYTESELESEIRPGRMKQQFGV